MHIEGLPDLDPQEHTFSLMTRPWNSAPGDLFCIASGIPDMETFNRLLTARIEYIQPEVRMRGVTENIFLGMIDQQVMRLVYRGCGQISAD